MILDEGTSAMAPAGQRIVGDEQSSRLVGDSACMQHVRSLIGAVAGRACAVLITGESGTGKELVARQIHAFGPRAGGPFIPVDCATLRDTLFESQLFGHVKGAFTGAEQTTLGFFRAADGGTLFLDEIGELDPHVQARLLRCIQDSAVVPLGGIEAIPVDVRIIAATNRDLRALLRRGEFREDLFYRLNVVNLQVPPLRARTEDVALLAEHFLRQLASLYEEPVKVLSSDAIAAMKTHRWPGNVRELANAIEHAYVLSEGSRITSADLPAAVRTGKRRIGMTDDASGIVPLELLERRMITRALRAAGGNQARAAELLQIERRRLYRKVRQYGLESLTRTRRL